MSRHAGLKEAQAGPVVGLLLEIELSAVLHELLELVGVSAAELLKGRLNLLLFDSGVLLVLGATWESLPWELTLKEVQKDMAYGLQVVSPGLLDSFMRRNGGVSSSASQVFAVFVRDVLALTVFVALGETEVDDVDVVASGLCATDQEVVGFDVTVDDPLFVHFFNALDHLDCDHEDSLEVEVPFASL